MCNPSHIELTRSMYRRARTYYITRAWGMNIDPITLSAILDSLQNRKPQQVGPDQKVTVNSRVTLLDMQENQRCTLAIVTPQESDPEAGAISFLSPLGTALMSKTAGEVVCIPVLGSTMRYRVLIIDT